MNITDYEIAFSLMNNEFESTVLLSHILFRAGTVDTDCDWTEYMNIVHQYRIYSVFLDYGILE